MSILDIATLKPQPTRHLEHCAACGGQLAVLAGVLCRGLAPGEILEKDTAGRVAESQLERGADNQVTDRARRGIFFGCGSCRQPVLPDHPRQLDLDRQWRERDASDAAARARAEHTPPAKTTPYAELNPVRALEERVEALEKLVNQLGREIAGLRAQLRKAK